MGDDTQDPEGQSQWAAAAIKAAPQLLWIGFAVIVFFMLREPIVGALKDGDVSKVSVVGVEIEFARDQFAKVPGLKGSEGTIKTAAGFEPYAERIARSAAKIAGARALWVDDRNPTQNFQERRAFTALGISFDLATSTEQAMELLRAADNNGTPYHFIISDIGRDAKIDPGQAQCYPMSGSPRAAGCATLQAIKARYGEAQPPIIFYTSQGDGLGTPPGAFGVTNRLDQLLELVLDAVERRPDSVAQMAPISWDGGADAVTADAPSAP